MSAMLGILLRTAILDTAAYEDWRERPNLFLRGIVLILLVTLVAGIVVFTVRLVNTVTVPDAADIQARIDEVFEQQLRWNPAWQNMDPEARAMIDEMMAVMVPMITDITQIRAPLPQGVVGFFQGVGAWISRALVALAGWLAYGALVLVVANLLGGSAKLPDFLGTVALYSIPALLGFFSPVPCLGALLSLVGAIWSIVVYIKATAVATGIDGGRAVLAVLAPVIILTLLGILLMILWVTWMVIIF